MIRLIYSLCLWLCQPLVRYKLLRRGRSEPGYREAVAERFGSYGDAPWRTPRLVIWVHAVSLGETRAAAELVRALRRRFPSMRLLLTHGTATGRQAGLSLLQGDDVQVWQPWDTGAAVRKFLTHFQPSVGILMETEVWPNLAQACRARALPLVLVNARMSAASHRRARWFAALARPAYASLRAVWAQTSEDAQRLADLGAPVRGVFGNLKFDAAPDPDLLAQGQAWRGARARPVLLLASSREGEELELLSILKEIQAAGHVQQARGAINLVADVQWLIVPRHPQRFDTVAQLIREQGFLVSRRSDWNTAGPPAPGLDAGSELTVWLGDTLGEMPLYYGLSDLALLGGSFEPLGGQNLIEAGACGVPVVTGPHTFNFAQAADLAVRDGAARRVADLAQAVHCALTLLKQPETLSAMRQAALAFAQAHRGALERTVAALERLLDEQGVDAA